MKYTLFLLPVILLSLAAGSCTGKGARERYAALQAENDSLRLIQAQTEREVNDYLSAINTIRDNIETIKRNEQILTRKKNAEGLPKSDLEQIDNDLQMMTDLLRTNREQLNRLRAQIANSHLRIDELGKTVDVLTERLEQANETVAALTEELYEKEWLIGNMSTTIATQASDIEQLETVRSEQEESLNAAWYAMGTRKELQQQKIINRRGALTSQRVLSEDFNQDYFVQIDIRDTQEIPLYASRAKILTIHPKGSYQLEKRDKNYVLCILDYHAFWSVSRYLVVEVN